MEVEIQKKCSAFNCSKDKERGKYGDEIVMRVTQLWAGRLKDDRAAAALQLFVGGDLESQAFNPSANCHT